MLLALLAALSGCGADDAADPGDSPGTSDEPTLEELEERYRREAADEINADNAARIAEELRKEIEADEGN